VYHPNVLRRVSLAANVRKPSQSLLDIGVLRRALCLQHLGVAHNDNKFQAGIGLPAGLLGCAQAGCLR